MRPVTINGGAVMRAWYDIKTLDLERHVEEAHLEESGEQLEAWGRPRKRALGIPSEKIVVAGFSQGGAIVLYAGLQAEERLGGILALSPATTLFPTLLKKRASEGEPGCPHLHGPRLTRSRRAYPSCGRDRRGPSRKTATTSPGIATRCRTACRHRRSPT